MMLNLNELIGFGVQNRQLKLLNSAVYLNPSVTFTLPDGIKAGQLLLVFDFTSNNVATSPTTVIPSEFTSISNITGAGQRRILSYKIADGTESGTTLTGMTGNETRTKALLVFGYDSGDKIVSATPTNVIGELTDGTPANQTQNASATILPVIVIGAMVSQNGSGGMVPVNDGILNIPTTVYSNSFLTYKIFESQPVSLTLSQTDGGVRNSLQSFYFTIG